MKELFPDRKFRRIAETENQYPVTNNGSAVGARVTIKEQDGLFLVNER